MRSLRPTDLGRVATAVLIAVLAVPVAGSYVAAQPIPIEIKKIVTYIFVPGKDGKPVANGTGFFVGVKDPSHDDRFTTYLVTAKHVLRPHAGAPLFPDVLVRLNTKDGGSQMVQARLLQSGPGKNVFVHDEAMVDLAVIRANFNANHDHLFFPADLILSKSDMETLKIAEGSEVFFTGLFTPHVGVKRNFPIVRFGRVALLTDERIAWKVGGQQKVDMMELLIVESASYGGNSGSPVMFYLGMERTPGSLTLGRLMRLAGVMQGAFNELPPIQVVETARTPVSLSNIGIAAVVPSWKLRDILFGEELRKLRGF